MGGLAAPVGQVKMNALMYYMTASWKRTFIIYDMISVLDYQIHLISPHFTAGQITEYDRMGGVIVRNYKYHTEKIIVRYRGTGVGGASLHDETAGLPVIIT